MARIAIHHTATVELHAISSVGADVGHCPTSVSGPGGQFSVWRGRRDEYVLLTGLRREQPPVQMAALRDCLTDGATRELPYLEMGDRDRSDVETPLDALEKCYANGLLNGRLSAKSSTKDSRHTVLV